MKARLMNWQRDYEMQKLKMLGYGKHNWLPQLGEETYQVGDKVKLKAGTAIRPTKGGIGALESDTEFEVVDRGGRTMLNHPQYGDIMLTQEQVERMSVIKEDSGAMIQPGATGNDQANELVPLSSLVQGDYFRIQQGLGMPDGRVISGIVRFFVHELSGGWVCRTADGAELVFSKKEADDIMVLPYISRPTTEKPKGVILAG